MSNSDEIYLVLESGKKDQFKKAKFYGQRLHGPLPCNEQGRPDTVGKIKNSF